MKFFIFFSIDSNILSKPYKSNQFKFHLYLSSTSWTTTSEASTLRRTVEGIRGLWLVSTASGMSQRDQTTESHVPWPLLVVPDQCITSRWVLDSNADQCLTLARQDHVYLSVLELARDHQPCRSCPQLLHPTWGITGVERQGKKIVYVAKDIIK